MQDSELVIRAAAFAIEAHGNQMYGEHPYAFHLSGVVRIVEQRNAKVTDKGYLERLKAVAWLHDTIEDTFVTFVDLVEEFGYDIAIPVACLTKDINMGYEEYIKLCKENIVSREVKICDTLFNLNMSFMSNRLAGMRKYPKQLDLLVNQW